MHNIVFIGNIDLTEVILATFFLFFAGLIVYLRREDRREGYPLEDESGRLEPTPGMLFFAQPKTFSLAHGGVVVTKPNDLRESRDIAARQTSRAPGSPLEPTGEGVGGGIGPGAFAQRARTPDMTFHGAPKIVPLRADTSFYVAEKSPDPRGMTVVGLDGVVAGVVSDVWVDRSEYLIRYLEVELGGGGRRVLLPMTMSVVNKGARKVKVDAITGAQFAGVPALASPDQVTLDEEERIVAYYGGGYLYATAQRSEPFL
jgi:photosynthetic reaction center H subunit